MNLKNKKSTFKYRFIKKFIALVKLIILILNGRMLNLENKALLIIKYIEYLDVCYSNATNQLPANSHEKKNSKIMNQNRIIALNNPNYLPISSFNTSNVGF